MSTRKRATRSDDTVPAVSTLNMAELVRHRLDPFRYYNKTTGELVPFKSETPPAFGVAPASNLLSDLLAHIFLQLTLRTPSRLTHSTTTRELLLLRQVSKYWSAVSRLPQSWMDHSSWICKIKLEPNSNWGEPPTEEKRQKDSQNVQTYLDRLVQTMPNLHRLHMDQTLCSINPTDINWKLSLAKPICRLREIDIVTQLYSEFLISLIQHLPLLDTLILKNAPYAKSEPLSVEAENALALLPLKHLSIENMEWTTFFKRFHSSRLASHVTRLDLMMASHQVQRRRYEHAVGPPGVITTNSAVSVTKEEVASFTKLTQLAVTIMSEVDLPFELSVLSLLSNVVNSKVLGINLPEFSKFQSSHSRYLYIDTSPIVNRNDESLEINWPTIKQLINACTEIDHLQMGLTDMSQACIEVCGLMKSRGTVSSPSTVNGVTFKESICTECRNMVAPLQTCTACQVTACGPCLSHEAASVGPTAAKSTSEPRTRSRHHFICHSEVGHKTGGIIYCYPHGPCDDHVLFQCPKCIDRGAGDTSPNPCDVCGILACYEHFAYGRCPHNPEMKYRCSDCRCRKCRYSCGAFSGDGDDDSDDDGDENEDVTDRPSKKPHFEIG